MGLTLSSVAGRVCCAAALRAGRATGKVWVEADPVSLAIVYPFYAGRAAEWANDAPATPRHRHHYTLNPSFLESKCVTRRVLSSKPLNTIHLTMTPNARH